MRAMDNRYFNILGHATGRLLLKRPGYEIDIERVIEQARKNGQHGRPWHGRGADHRCGIDQARRAGLEKTSILNCLPWEKLQRFFSR